MTDLPEIVLENETIPIKPVKFVIPQVQSNKRYKNEKEETVEKVQIEADEITRCSKNVAPKSCEYSLKWSLNENEMLLQVLKKGMWGFIFDKLVLSE